MRTLPVPAPDYVRCPACGADRLTDIFEVSGQPVFVGVLYASEDEARCAPTGDITLAYCHVCGLVHNRRFEAERVPFAPGYEVSLAHSATFTRYTNDVAQRLVDRYGLVGRRVLEIGCGGGFFMQLLCERGIGEGIGIDPTVSRVGTERVAGRPVTWIRDYYEPDTYAGPEPDFVCSLSVFEDIPRPGAFLAALRVRLLERETPVYFEVYNAGHAFELGETWSIHYEQCNLFDPTSLRTLFARSGFRILDSGASYEGDQYTFVEALPGPLEETDGPALRSPLPGRLRHFAERYVEQAKAWQDRLSAFKRDGRRVVLWGSGGKGISFLNTVPAAEDIPCVVDINPDRQGRHIPGAGQPIVAPAELTAVRPDTIVITNPLYEHEIREQVASLGLTCGFETA